MTETERLFGGDAARQRAELYAARKRPPWKVAAIGTGDGECHPFRLNLDIWGRGGRPRTQYTHVAYRIYRIPR